MLEDINRAKIVTTNYHAFKFRERIELPAGGRSLLQGRTGEALNTLETEGQMLQRVMPDLMGLKNILAINDEAHHCCREKPKDVDDVDLKGDEKKEAEKNDEATRLWISGLEAVNRKLGLSRVIDLSATPFPLSGFGRALRRQSYDLNEENLFNVEYADVFGIPFDFTAKPVIAPPKPPRQTIQVKAIHPERDSLEISFPRVEGYRIELPEERLSADFNDESVLEPSPDPVGPSITRNSGIMGEGVDLSLKHLGDMRPSTLVFQITQRLLYTKWRDPGEEPKLYLFGQLKRITKQWLDTCLVCKGDTYPALLMYQDLADMACNRITAAITRQFLGERPIKALLDTYNPTGSTMHVRFNTSKTDLWETSSKSCHLNWVVLDSDWEGEFCRVGESHPRVRAYVKNHDLGFEVPYRYGSETRHYVPDFIVLVDDGHGEDNLLHLIVEIKGCRREDAKEKKSTMDTYRVPGVDNLCSYGRWAFAEFTGIYQIESDFKARVEDEFNTMLAEFGNPARES